MSHDYGGLEFVDFLSKFHNIVNVKNEYGSGFFQMMPRHPLGKTMVESP